MFVYFSYKEKISLDSVHPIIDLINYLVNNLLY